MRSWSSAWTLLYILMLCSSAVLVDGLIIIEISETDFENVKSGKTSGDAIVEPTLFEQVVEAELDTVVLMRLPPGKQKRVSYGYGLDDPDPRWETLPADGNALYRDLEGTWRLSDIQQIHRCSEPVSTEMQTAIADLLPYPWCYREGIASFVHPSKKVKTPLQEDKVKNEPTTKTSPKQVPKPAPPPKEKRKLPTKAPIEEEEEEKEEKEEENVKEFTKKEKRASVRQSRRMETDDEEESEPETPLPRARARGTNRERERELDRDLDRERERERKRDREGDREGERDRERRYVSARKPKERKKKVSLLGSLLSFLTTTSTTTSSRVDTKSKTISRRRPHRDNNRGRTTRRFEEEEMDRDYPPRGPPPRRSKIARSLSPSYRQQPSVYAPRTSEKTGRSSRYAEDDYLEEDEEDEEDDERGRPLRRRHTDYPATTAAEGHSRKTKAAPFVRRGKDDRFHATHQHLMNGHQKAIFYEYWDQGYSTEDAKREAAFYAEEEVNKEVRLFEAGEPSPFEWYSPDHSPSRHILGKSGFRQGQTRVEAPDPSTKTWFTDTTPNLED